jgi:hypothetical protein
VTGVQTCALPIWTPSISAVRSSREPPATRIMERRSRAVPQRLAGRRPRVEAARARKPTERYGAFSDGPAWISSLDSPGITGRPWRTGSPVIGRGACGDAESFVHSGEDGELDAGYEAVHEGTHGAGGVGADHEAVSDVVAVAVGAVPGPIGLG